MSTHIKLQILENLCEEAWGIIANAGGGNWNKETQEWQDAAKNWRDRYHTILPSGCDCGNHECGCRDNELL